ncbi:MAG: RNA-binding domain-containing protein [Methanothrix sp.]|nr:RNA-binding domain-containing protein [Methanothrix sp.]
MIDRISFRAFVAATEDEGRVREALAVFAPLDRITAVTAEGHFGNEIKILEAVLRRKEAAAFLQILREQLSAEDLERLRREIPDRLEGDSHFHLRLDKQAAYKGLVRLTNSKDALDITILVRTYPARRESALKILSELI